MEASDEVIVGHPTSPAVLTGLLAELARNNVKLRLLDSGQLEITAPAGRITPGLRERLTEHKPQLLEWLASATAPNSATLPSIVPDPAGRYEPYPLADLQMSFLIGSGEGMEYHVRPHQYLELDFAELEPERFETALNTALRWQRGNLVVLRQDMMLQAVRDPEPVRVRVADLRRLDADRALAAIEKIRAGMERDEPPLDQWPWLDVRISRYGAGRARLHYNNNNFFSDALGTRRFLDTVLRLYENPAEHLPPLAISYRDCVLALARLEDSPLGRRSQAYWTDRLPALPEAPGLPLAAGADSRARSRLERRELIVPEPLWAAFKCRAAGHGLTPTSALYGVYAEVLAAWSGSAHFLVNNMITHRLPLHPQMDEVLGNFASLYPLEVDWRHDEPFRERVRRLQAQVMADMDHSYWSGVKVLQAINQQRHTPGKAVCPYVIGSALAAGPSDLPVASLLETPQVLLDCELFELRDGALWVIWDVIESMFPAGMIDSMHAAYRWLLTELAERDKTWDLTSIDLLPAEQRERRARVNGTAAPVPAGRLHDALAAAPARDTAVISASAVLSYGELRRRSAVVADRLLAYITRSGDLVAIAAPKGWEQVVAVFGTLIAGAGYVPADPDWPADRFRLISRDAGVRAVLTTEALRDRVAATCDVPVLAVDAHGASGPGLERQSQPGDRAYVIYTSGTTGRPKGAVLDHQGPLNTIADINHRFGIGRDDVLLGLSSLCFDLSVYDIFGAAAAGATLVLPDPGSTDPAGWAKLALAHGVTVWNSVPALMELFAEEALTARLRFPTLRIVLLSGDWIPVTLPTRVRAIAPNARVISLGGATEASIWSIFYPADHDEPGRSSIPYGRPLANQTWHVLDGAGRDLPDWVPGDLHIGGTGLALGYLNDPDKTAAAFVRHPRTGERLYRTGDLGRYLPSGDIEFLGRADFQVKIQGFRVEPGEVEHVLGEHPDVRQAVVIARASGSGKQLAAFVVPGEEAAWPEPAALRGYLSDRLPAYLVPDHVTVLGRLPLTPNGKVDRRALETLRPDSGDRRRRVPPRDDIESALAGIWESVLSCGLVGAHDDFFELGGQSLAALRVIRLIAQRWGVRLPLGALLEAPTVARLSERIRTAGPGWSPLVRLRETGAGDPWFWAHPAGGGALCYRRLAELLDGPSWAFHADSRPRPLPATVTDLAGEYLRELLAVRPVGPYLIGGWSSGAVIAFELVRLLEERGELVRRLVVADAPAPGDVRDVDEATALLWYLEDLDQGFRTGEVTAEDVAAVTANQLGQLTRALELGVRHGLSGVLEPTSLDASYQTFRSMIRACHQYRPGIIGADITLLRGSEGVVTEFSAHPGRRAPHWGWASLTTGTVSVTRIRGATHHTLLRDPHVAAAAEAIAAPLTGRER
jgi:pyochelin synthetase